MRVLHVVTLVSADGAYGGPLRVALNVARELRDQGVEAELAGGWTGAGGAPRMAEDVPAHLFPVARIPGLGFSGMVSVRLVRHLWRNVRSYDVVHVHAARELVPLLALLVCVVRRVPVVAQPHGMIVPHRRAVVGLLDAVVTRRLLARAGRLLALNPGEERAVRQVVGEAVAVDRVGNGVRRVATRLPDAERVAEVIFCARLHPRKRVLAFADMAELLIERGYQHRFVVIGPDEGDLPALLERAAEMQPGRLRYEGALPHAQVLERLSTASAFVLPAIDEPWGMSLVEALSVGTPSVCTTSSHLARTLQDNRAALVAAPPALGLADAVAQLLDDPALRAELSRNGADLVEREFSMTAVALRLLDLYRVVARGTAAAECAAVVGPG